MQDDEQSAGKHDQPSDERPETTEKRTARDSERKGTKSFNREDYPEQSARSHDS